jgi:hypothetical protein
MQAELRHALDVCEAEVLSFIAPLEQVGLSRGGGGALPLGAHGHRRSSV